LLRHSGKKGHFEIAWPADLIVRVASDIYRGYNLINAWCQVPRGAVEAEVDSVRNRILALVLQIESEAPDAGDSLTSKTPLSQERITQMFTTNIYGNVGNVASGNRDVSQTATIQVLQGDIDSLKRYLASKGIEPKHLGELDAAIKEDGPQSKGLGQRVSGWIGKMLAEAGKGTWKVTTTAAASLLTKAIAAYYGLGE
jgi:hypothetical protein